MLTFLGLDWDSAPERGAKLKALQKYYRTSDPVAMNMLSENSLSPTNNKRGTDLVINSHGNRDVFAGYDAQQFFDLLVSKGFEQGSFRKIYLMACSVGKQDQGGSIAKNFARDFHLILAMHGIPSMVYAPRGVLSYCARPETKAGQTYWVVDKMYIKTPERSYPLTEGMLLVA